MIRGCTFLFSLTGLLVAASHVEAAFIANLSPNPGNHRVRSDAVVGNSEGSSPDLLGAVAGNRNHGAALLFNLSTIPDGATITSATLTFQTTGVDTNSTTDITDGSADINLFEYAIEPDTCQWLELQLSELWSRPRWWHCGRCRLDKHRWRFHQRQ